MMQEDTEQDFAEQVTAVNFTERVNITRKNDLVENLPASSESIHPLSKTQSFSENNYLLNKTFMALLKVICY